MAKKTKKKETVIPKILIGIPILAWTHEFATSFLSFWTDLMMYEKDARKFHVAYKFMYRKPVHMAEEELAQFALDNQCTHLLLMDDDIYDVTADMLLKLLDADKDVIGGIMHASGYPHAMCAFRRYDRKTKVADQPILKGPARLYEIPPEQRKGVQHVDLIPFCFTLIKTTVFQKLKKPWFTCDTQAPTDSWFADAMLTKGFSYFAHFDCWVNHRGVTRHTLPAWLNLGMAQAQEKNSAQIVLLTPEEMQRHEAMMRLKLADAEVKAKKANRDSTQFYEKKKGKKFKKVKKKK